MFSLVESYVLILAVRSVRAAPAALRLCVSAAALRPARRRARRHADAQAIRQPRARCRSSARTSVPAAALFLLLPRALTFRAPSLVQTFAFFVLGRPLPYYEVSDPFWMKDQFGDQGEHEKFARRCGQQRKACLDVIGGVKAQIWAFDAHPHFGDTLNENFKGHIVTAANAKDRALLAQLDVFTFWEHGISAPYLLREVTGERGKGLKWRGGPGTYTSDALGQSLAGGRPRDMFDWPSRALMGVGAATVTREDGRTVVISLGSRYVHRRLPVS